MSKRIRQVVFLNEASQSLLKTITSLNDGYYNIILNGRRGLFIPSIEEVVRRNKGFEFIAIESSGHVYNIDQPEKFNKLLMNYIAKIE